MYNNQTPSNNLVQVVNDDYLFVQQLLNRKVRLSNFKRTGTVTILTEGQNASFEFKASSYDFLLKDIQVFGYCQAGNFMPNGIARDLITLTLKNTATDDMLVDAGTDIQAFSPINVKSTFTPTIISKDSGLLSSFKHERKVGDDCIDFPKSGSNIGSLTLSFGTGVSTAPNPFPVYLQIVLSGAKIFPDGR